MGKTLGSCRHSLGSIKPSEEAILLPKDVYHLKVQTKRQAMRQVLSDHRVGECLIVSLYP